MVYYRKYRPQTIEELDSTKVRETLSAVLSAKEIPHAFLFTGPKGLGKTSTARIIAKIVNCTNMKKGSINPCNECDSCKSITNGSNVDVLEIDGASNRGIDEIRDLRDKVKLAPSSAKKKVYIIDEVHMLTTEAFNALLKTIEEPPDHVMFMFATTEPQKVPATILSRCFHIAFPRATDEDVVHSLERIVKGEKLHIDNDALFEMAKMADGGFRDAAKMLEEIVALVGGKEISKEFVEKHNNTTGVSLEVDEFLGALKRKNGVAEAILKISAIINQGVSIKYFIEQILLKLHAALLGNMKLEKYPVNLPDFEDSEIKKLNDLFSKAYQETKYAVVPQLPLELAVVEWCGDNSKVKTQSSNVEESEAEDVTVATPQVAVSVATKSAPTIAEVRKKEQNLKVRNIIDGFVSSKQKTSDKVVPSINQGALKADVNLTSQLMENIIYKVKPYNHSLAGVLRGCDIASFADGQLILQTAYKFHQERLQDMKSVDILEKVIKEITGKQIKVLVELKG